MRNERKELHKILNFQLNIYILKSIKYYHNKSIEKSIYFIIPILLEVKDFFIGWLP